ncbi:transcriptional regulator [Actinorhabdospora filicis]|uniref:Transcriptional regulator n=2 Tax=Actinorhabdospora filicis TaxID=1785913 RepID=A0A9W6W3K0_9ACTN|nr:transcriptional regulator [Actinorhabdospora filicis]
MSTYDVERSKCINSRRTLARIENGQVTSMPYTVIGGLARLYGADTALASELERMYRAADEPGWYEEYGQAVREGFATFAEAEQTADRMCLYDPGVITGLCQIDAYASALFLLHPLYDKTGVEPARRFRKRRQRDYWGRVEREGGPQTTIILSETTVRRPVGGVEVLAAQLGRLRELARLPGVDLRILPLSVEDHPAPDAGSFTIFDFNDPLDPDIVYFEHLDGCRYVETIAAVAAYRVVFDALHDHAIAVEEFLGGHFPVAQIEP